MKTRNDTEANFAVRDCSRPWLPRLCKCRTFYPMDKSYGCAWNNTYCRLTLAFLFRLRCLDIIKSRTFYPMNISLDCTCDNHCGRVTFAFFNERLVAQRLKSRRHCPMDTRCYVPCVRNILCSF